MSRFAFIESNTSGTGRIFIERARQFARPILLTTEPSRYSFLDSCPVEIHVLDTSDVQAMEAFCRLGEVSAVWTTSEYFVAKAAELAAGLGLPGPDFKAVGRARDKAFQREALRRAGIASPRSLAASSVAAAVAAAARLGFPVVVKPTHGSGSVGIRLCRDQTEVRRHCDGLMSSPRNERGLEVSQSVLVEEYLDGPEYSVEVLNGQVVAVVAKKLGSAPFFVEIGHDVPALIAPQQLAHIHRYVRRVVEVFGLTWGPVHVELRLRDGKPFLIEVNPRLAGGFIPELVRLAGGIDLIKETLLLALGRPPESRMDSPRSASIRFLTAPAEGLLKAYRRLAVAAAMPGVEAVETYRRAGETLTLDGSFRDRVGHVVAVADESHRAAFLAEAAQRSIQVEVHPTVDLQKEVA